MCHVRTPLPLIGFPPVRCYSASSSTILCNHRSLKAPITRLSPGAFPPSNGAVADSLGSRTVCNDQSDGINTRKTARSRPFCELWPVHVSLCDLTPKRRDTRAPGLLSSRRQGGLRHREASMFDTRKQMIGGSTLFVANLPSQSGEGGPTIRRAEMFCKSRGRFN